MADNDIGFGPLKGPDQANLVGFSRLANGCISTVGAALPSFAGRAVGDLHSKPPVAPSVNAKPYVLTGTNGRTFSDTFNRVNSDLVGRGWVQAGGDFSIVGNQAYTTSPSAALLQNFGHEDHDVTATLYGGGQPGVIAYTTSANGVTTGYRAQVSLSSTGTNVILLKTNAQVAAGHAGAVGAALTTPPVVTLSIRGLVVQVFVNYVLVLTFTDTAGSQPTGSWSGVTTDAGGGNSFDNVTIATPGTLAWTPLGGGADLSTDPPPGVNYTASQVGADVRAAHGDHTHKSLQFAYDFVIVT